MSAEQLRIYTAAKIRGLFLLMASVWKSAVEVHMQALWRVTWNIQAESIYMLFWLEYRVLQLQINVKWIEKQSLENE